MAEGGGLPNRVWAPDEIDSLDLFDLNLWLFCGEPKGEIENFSEMGDTGGDANGSRRLRKSDASGDPGLPSERWEGDGEGVTRGRNAVRLNSALGKGRTCRRAGQMNFLKIMQTKSLR